MTRRGEFAGRADRLLHRARSGFTGQALPAFFGPLELLQYLRRHLSMPFLIGMHVERVPIAVVQIDRDREHVCRRRLRLSAEMKRPGPITKIFLPFNSGNDARTARNAFVSSVSSLGVPFIFIGSSSSNGKSCHPMTFKKNASG